MREFVIRSSEAGMDVFRMFDSLNYLPNLKGAMETVGEADKIAPARRLFVIPVTSLTLRRRNMY